MTKDQLEQLKAMDYQARFHKYTPMLIGRAITKAQYDRIFSIPYTGDGDFRLDSSGPVRDGGPAPDTGSPDPHMGSGGSDTGSESDQVVESLLQAFGGSEVTTHPERMTGDSQKARLYNLLVDGEWHATDEIQKVVYGKDHLGVARIAARIHDLKKDGYRIESVTMAGTLWQYKMITGFASPAK